MREEDLIYSFSNGNTWSKYSHCKTWENGLHTLIVKDKYNQTTTTTINVTNNHKSQIDTPSINSGSYISGTWTNENVIVSISSTYNIIKSSVDGGDSWSTVNSPITYTSSSDVLYKVIDEYGNESDVVFIVIKIDKTVPTNLNFVPEVTPGRKIKTVVEAIDNDSALKYSISYDGSAWSTPQIGKIFILNSASVGSHTINCRAYNAAGIYVEGTPVTLVVS